MRQVVSTPDEASLERYLQANTVSPCSALVFYMRAGKLALTTAHRITAIKGVPHLAPGRPMCPEDEARIVALLSAREDETAGAGIRLMPPDVLHTDAASTTWLFRSRIAPMVLRRQGADTTVLTRWPTLVMHARRRQLFVAALASDQWPTEDAELYHAPIANVWTSGQMCTGSAILPMGCTPADIAGWNGVLTDSAFTHKNHDAAITVRKPTAGGKRTRKARSEAVEHPDPMDYWSGMDGVQTPFPAEHLTPLKLSLSRWLAGLIGGSADDDA